MDCVITTCTRKTTNWYILKRSISNVATSGKVRKKNYGKKVKQKYGKKRMGKKYGEKSTTIKYGGKIQGKQLWEKVTWLPVMSLPVTWLTSLPVTSLPVAPHCSSANDNLSSPLLLRRIYNRVAGGIIMQILLYDSPIVTLYDTISTIIKRKCFD